MLSALLMLRIILTLFFCFPALLFADPDSVILAVGQSRTLQFKEVTRVAVANSKLLKVKALDSEKVWLSAIRPGTTDVRIWTQDKEETLVVVTVTSNPRWDEPEPVVKVALEFLELEGSLARNLGVRWPDAIHFSSSGQWSSQTSGVNLSVAFTSAQAWLQHLVREGWGKILAAPDLYVRLGEEANFHSGGELPIANASTQFGTIQRNIQWKPYGLTVKVRPQSSDYLHIHSDIQVEISEVSPTRAIEGVPALTKRSLQTKMHSREAETVILSGLVRQADSEEKSRVPFLSEVPLLGPLLFGATEQRQQETEVFMAVTFSFTSRQKTREQIDAFHKKFEQSQP